MDEFKTEYFYSVVLRDPETGVLFLSSNKYPMDCGGLAAIKEKAGFVSYATGTVEQIVIPAKAI